ncbi:MAG: hypothetical protein INH13_25830 [Cupriavidus sp.]|nr:hypothetical protein [Cupriavidus sp.]
MNSLDTPIRLTDAAKRFFPEGGMTVAGLRRERDRGNLVTYMVAGKEYVTERNVMEMLKCVGGFQPRKPAPSRRA